MSDEVQYASFDDIIAKVTQDNEEDFTTSYGLTVRLRGLTRAEHLWSGKTDDRTEMEVRVLTKGLVKPKLTVPQIKEWQSSGSSKSVSEITNRIGELSGLIEGAEKSDL